MIILTATMIVGVITVVGLLVTRMPKVAAPLALPEAVALPQDVQAAAVTLGRDFIAVVTNDNRILIFNRDGSLRQEVLISPAASATTAP